MKRSEIKLKTKMLKSLNGLVGKTITEVYDENHFKLLNCDKESLLIVYDVEYHRCGDQEIKLKISTDPINDVGLIDSHILGLLNDEDYVKYENFLNQEERKKKEERKKIEQEKQQIKEKQQYEEYLKLKMMYENKKL